MEKWLNLDRYLIDLDEVLYIEEKNNCTYVTFKNNGQIVVEGNLNNEIIRCLINMEKGEEK